MPGCYRRRSTILTLAAAAVMPSLLATSALATTYVFSNPLGGALNVSTNYAPSGMPGTADVFRLNALPTIAGFLTLTVAANQTIGRLEFNHFAPNTINANLDPANGNAPFTLTLSTGQIAFLDSITEAPDVPLDTVFINAPLAGGAGLTKSGPGFAFLTANNIYTGGTTISGPGGLSVAKDAALGAAAGSVSLNTGGTLRTVSSFATSRALVVGTGGGRIESFGTLTLNGDVGGSGALTIDRFTGGSVVMSAANSFTGNLIIADTNTVQLTGRMSSVNAVTLGGTLDLGTDRNNLSTPVLRNAAAINSLGGTLMLSATNTDSTAAMGALTLTSGTTTLDTEPSLSGRAIMSFSGFTRANRSTAFLRGRDLGDPSSAPNKSVIDTSFGAIPGAIGGGGTTATNASIYPFFFGNRNVTGGTSQVSVVDAGLVTRGTFGYAPLTAAQYATTIGAAATDNVRLSDNAFTQNAAATMNALVIRDTLASNGQSGVTGTGALTITSGAIVAVTDLAGEELFIDNPVNFGAAEGIVHTAPTSDGFSQLTMRGVISGSNGFTKSGAGELFIESTANTYTGVTTIDAGTLTYSGNVAANVAGALGNSASDVIINAGVTGGQYVGLRAATAQSAFGRNIVVHQDANAASLAFIGTYGGYGATFTGQITIDAGFLNLLGDLEPEELTFAGAIVGAGGVQEPGTALPQQQFLQLSGANTYTGGTVIRAGRWDAGSNTAVGTGTVYFVGNNDASSTQTGALQASGAARSLANTFVFRATPIFSGSNALTLTGGIDLGSVPREINVTNSADVTMSGVVSRGGLTKTGSGRLILSGANTFNGQVVVSEGTLRIANNAALGEATGPNGPGQATFITGAGSLELAGGIATAESIYLSSGSQPITLASPTGNLRSVSGNNTINGQVAFDNVGTIGVDAVSTLTLTSDAIDNTTGLNAALRKVGAGTLILKNVRLPTLAISGGTVQIANAGAPLGTSRVSTLTIDPTATLDITNNTLVYDYTSASPITAVRSLLASGRIVTSATQTGARVGYVEATSIFAANTFPNSFAGQVVDNTTVLIQETLGGDATFDRIVNFDDLVVLAQNYNATGKFWHDGDFNYDGSVNFDDLVILAQNYNGTATGALTAASFTSNFRADWALAQSLVPEPTMFLALTAIAPLARRRRCR